MEALETPELLDITPDEEHVVLTDDGVPLHAEIDLPAEAAAREAADGTTRHGRPEELPTVVLTHGYCLSLRCWVYQRRALKEAGYRVVSWDQRGHGRSGRGERDSYTIDRLGQDLHTVITELVPDGDVVLVGHSMGGMTIMALADAHPELFGDRVVGVALISTSPGKLAEVSLGVPAAAGRALRKVAPKALEALNRRPGLVAGGRRLGSDLEFVLTKRYSFATDVPPSLVRFVSRMHDQTGLDVLAELFPAFGSHDKLDALEVLNGVETLILAGDQDVMTPADHSRDMHEEVPGAELVVVPDAGHMIMLEHHALVSEHIRDLVERALRHSSSPRPA
jgi:pimeloyl-ACP methyl ester carboxylesterase